MPPPSKPEGITFPVTAKGDRSTTETNKKTWSASIGAVDSNAGNQVLGERNWRHKYNKYVIESVQKGLQSPDSAINAAQAGLDFLHKNFEFIRGEEKMTLEEAMKHYKGSFETGFIKGTKPKPEKFELEVPYKGKTLKGESLIQQLHKWADYGTIEPSAAEAIIEVVKNPQWVDLSDKYFVLLGAGSAMGPFLVLMALGANVIAIDLDRSNIWKRLISIAKDSCGTITFPLKVAQASISTDEELYQNAGSNLITQTPEIFNWLKDLYPEKSLIVGCYVYLDGEAHVRVALACDAIMKGLTETRQGVSLAYLCTPTDVHVIPDEARREMIKNYSGFSLANLLVMPIRLFGGNRYLAKNVLPQVEANNGKKFSLVDGLVVAQGPNYALAKRMQHWRAMVARSNNKCTVSSNIAPSTATASVVHNRQFAWAYDGMPFFKPMEIFDQNTSNAVMGALLIHDIRNPKSVAHPEVPLDNPLQLFTSGAFHGGVWRTGYRINTIGEVSALIHFVKVLGPYFLLAILVAIISFFWKQSH